MKSIIILIFGLGICHHLSAQQITYEPSTFAYSFVINPAMTASDNTMSFGSIYRKQWLGFSGSPQHMGIFGQYPFFDVNLSMGGFLTYETDGPFTTTTAGLTSSYKLIEPFLYEDLLTIGMGLKYSHNNINFDKLIARDQQSFLNNFTSETRNHLGVNFGLYYVTDASPSYKSRFIGGLGINNLQSMFFSDKKDNELFDPSTHYNLLVGYDYKNFKFKAIKEGFGFFLKPILWLDYAVYSPLRIMIGLDAGMTNFLYSGIYVSNESSIHLKLAINMENESLGDGRLKVEIFPSYNFGKLKEVKGFSFDVGVAYLMDMD